MIEVRFREEAAFFAFFEVGKNDVSGVCRKDETTPAEGDTSDSTSGTETEMSSWEELQELHGMDELRQRMEELAAYRRYMDQRGNMGFQTPLPPLHMAFMGNSTTKKQKVANLLGKLLCDLKFLNNGKVTYVDWDEFIQKMHGTNPLQTKKYRWQTMSVPLRGESCFLTGYLHHRSGMTTMHHAI